MLSQKILIGAFILQLLAAIVSYRITSDFVTKHFGDVGTTKDEVKEVKEILWMFSWVIWRIPFVLVLKPWWDLYLAAVTAGSMPNVSLPAATKLQFVLQLGAAILFFYWLVSAR